MRYLALMLVMVLVMVLAGCATITGNRTFDSKYNQIQKGVTSRQEVIDLLGSPTQVLHPDEKHTVLIFEKRKIYVESFGFGRRKIDTQRLSIFIDEKDVVTDYKMDTMSDDYMVQGGGAAVYNNYQTSQPTASYSGGYNTGAYHF